ncbi:MAG: hypothetical protein GXC75_04260 [Xanthomonadaceae bacterium]|nr:hypothetical protein [Xanthomonadaceae bacterium]
MKRLRLSLGLLVALALSGCNQPVEEPEQGGSAQAPTSPTIAPSATPPPDDPLLGRCMNEVATIYAVPLPSIMAEPMKPVADGFGIAGRVNKGEEGIKAYLCVFDRNKAFTHVEAMTPDGE